MGWRPAARNLERRTNVPWQSPTNVVAAVLIGSCWLGVAWAAVSTKQECVVQTVPKLQVGPEPSLHGSRKRWPHSAQAPLERRP